MKRQRRAEMGFANASTVQEGKSWKSYRMSGKRGKNDAADAAAICEAVARPNMRFVPIKSIKQQSENFRLYGQAGA